MSSISTPGTSSSLIGRTTELNNGKKMPVIGFGTFRIVEENAIFTCLEAALKAGYRSIDTAAVYGNEEHIGKALKVLLPKYNLKREDIFITSKLSPKDLHPQRVVQAVKKSLSNLQVSYLDLYLIHWPGASGLAGESEINAALREAAWEKLVELNKKGLLHSIGVSNYTIKHLKILFDKSYGVIPAVNQVEIHPHLPQLELISFCQENKIAVEAYGSLGGAPGVVPLLEDPAIQSIAKNIGRPVPQVLLRWALQHNLVIIPKSVSPERIVSNTQLDFEISSEDMTKLDNLPTRTRYAWDPDTIA